MTCLNEQKENTEEENTNSNAFSCIWLKRKIEYWF